MIHQLVSPDEMENQKKLFSRLDKNHDGHLSRDDLIKGFREIYGEVVEAEVDEIYNLADLSGNGLIDYSEWLVATTKKANLLNQQKLRQAFAYFDKNNTGKVSVNELQEIMGNMQNEGLDDQVFKDILDEVDEKKDGVLDFEEF